MPNNSAGSTATRRSLAAAAGLLIVLCLELALSARQQSQTFDEAAHILAGVHYWDDKDFGINPEHPPLVKLVAALPLLGLRPIMPAVPEGYFKSVEYFAGQDFMRANGTAAPGSAGARYPDAILFRSRMASAVFMVFLAALVFAATTELFGAGPGVLALLLVVFEPNLLAHGALVTTDVGVTCCLFLTVYTFYRYVRKSSALRLLWVGVAAGLTLAAKHSGLLVLPILTLLAGAEVFLWRKLNDLTAAPLTGACEPGTFAPGRGPRAERIEGKPQQESSHDRTAAALHLAAALLLVGVIAVAVLWAFYGFRYRARPDGLAMTPDLQTYAAQIASPFEAGTIQMLARRHALPEAYLFGLTDVIQTAGETPGFLFGKVYQGGRWFYFPAVFVIKSTLGFLLLLLFAALAAAMRRRAIGREAAFLAIPAAFYFLVAAGSSLNLGVRHILPVYPFLLIGAAYGAWSLARQNRAWSWAIALLLGFHMASSVRAFPNYLAYSNEIAGGPAGTHNVLSESNVDWGQSLKAMKRYVDQHKITDCWFADFASLGADPAAYGIPCKPLPAGVTKALSTDIVPPAIAGPVFVSATELSGNYWGPGELNPYAQFLQARPDAEIGDSIFVFNSSRGGSPRGGGVFDVPLVSAVTHESRAALLAQANMPEQALAEAQAAATLAPNSVDAQAVLGDSLIRMNRIAEARVAFEKALALAQSVCPEYQSTWIAPLQTVLQSLPGG